MKTINPKCTNEDSFKYSVLISLYYHELNNHKERTNQLKTYIDKHNFTSNNYIDFENNNPFISLTIYDTYYNILHESINITDKKAQIVKVNNYRYHSLKPTRDKYTELIKPLKQFTHNEFTEYIMNKINH